MTVRTVPVTADTFTSSSRRGENFSSLSYVEVSASSSDTRHGYFFAPIPREIERGATVVSGKLRLVSYAAAAVSRTISARGLASVASYSRMSWVSQPAITGPTATLTSSTALGGQVWELDITAIGQAVSAGALWWGVRVFSSHADPLRFDAVNSRYADRRPVFVWEWADEPEQPVDLSPSGTGAIALRKPVLRWAHADYGGDTSLAAAQVQVRAPAGATVWDSGWDSTVVAPEMDLASTSYPGLPEDGSDHQWRVRVRDGDGLESVWSEWASFRYRARGTVSIIEPAGGVIMDPTLPVAWSFTGTQGDARVILYRGDQLRTEVWRSPRLGSAQATVIPSGIMRDDKTYTITVQAWDDVARQSTPGAPAYRQQSVTCFFDEDAAVPRPLTVVAAQRGMTPFVDIDVTTSVTPDALMIVRDGQIVARLTPADVQVAPLSFRWSDRTCPPHREARYEVRSLVAKRRSQARVAKVTVRPVGVWLTTDAETVCLSGREAGSPTLLETSTAHELGDRVVVITDALGGHAGDWSGELVGDTINCPGVSAQQHRGALMRIREEPKGARFHQGPVNVPVTLQNVVARALPDERLRYQASFAYWQQPGPELDSLAENG